jgi:plexin A
VINNNLYSDHANDSSAGPPKSFFHLKPPETALGSSLRGGPGSSSGGSHHGSHSMMEKAQKTIPEVFLTRLLSTKGTIKKFIDDFFRTILSTEVCDFPLPVKWLFDIFDESLRAGYLEDPDVVHAWKSNSLPLRFWINLVSDP